MTEEEKKQFRAEVMAEVCQLAEKAAQGHDELARKFPGGPDKDKANAIRRFADVFLK